MDPRTRRLEDLLRRVRENAGRTDPSRPTPALREAAPSAPPDDSPISLGWSALLGDIPPPAPLPLIEPSDDADGAVQSFPSSAPGPNSEPPHSFVARDDLEADPPHLDAPTHPIDHDSAPLLAIDPVRSPPRASLEEHAPPATAPLASAPLEAPPMEAPPRIITPEPAPLPPRPRTSDELPPPDSAIERAVRVALLARSDSEPPTLWRELELQPRRATIPPTDPGEAIPTPTLASSSHEPITTDPEGPPRSIDPTDARAASTPHRTKKPRRPKRMSPRESSAPFELTTPRAPRARTSPLAIGLGAIVAGATFAIGLRVLTPTPTLAEHVVSANLAACAPPLLSAPPTRTSLPPPTLPATRPPAPSTSASLLPPSPNARLLRPDEGYLLIAPPAGQASLKVFVQGVAAGDAGSWLRLPCGARFVRVAERLETAWGSSFPSWVEAGTTIVIPCRSHAVVHMDASSKPR